MKRVSIAGLALLLAVLAACTTPFPPINPDKTGIWDPGQILWADLLTNDVAAAQDFYAAVFGWQFVGTADDGYVQASVNDRPVAGIARHAPQEADKSEVVWLLSISVNNPGSALDAVEPAGGRILEKLRSSADRGRYAIIEDDQGAVVSLLTGPYGDPTDRRNFDNELVWAELWTRDPQRAISFYSAVVGYDAGASVIEGQEDVLLLTRNSMPKAGVVALPWDDVEPNWLPYMRVADITETIAAINAAGGSVLVAPDDRFNNGNVAIVSDPTGGAFAIQAQDEGS